jgi:hypothetical protein
MMTKEATLQALKCSPVFQKADNEYDTYELYCTYIGLVEDGLVLGGHVTQSGNVVLVLTDLGQAVADQNAITTDLKNE